jgi:hypothetical protein
MFEKLKLIQILCVYDVYKDRQLMKIDLFFINGFHRLLLNTVWKHLQETENRVFRY